MHPLSQKLARQFIGDFWSADHSITWTAVENERQLWLSPKVLLVGRVDAEGITGDGEPFFGDWKTLSASKGYRIEEEKKKWRTSVQALTYGVLVPGTRRFTVRWAIKPKASKGVEGPCSTAFEWYDYTLEEVAFWKGQLLEIGNEILSRRASGKWLKNRANCYRYGVKYPCPFLERCHALDFEADLGSHRVPHLDFERDNHFGLDVVVIDASRVDDYLECPEKYRKGWEGHGYHEDNENLVIGNDFHSLIAAHLGEIKRKGENANKGND